MKRKKVHKFAIGDRVELIRIHGMSARKGATATVGPRGNFKNPRGKTWYVDILWDHQTCPLVGRQENGGYFPSHFRKL